MIIFNSYVSLPEGNDSAETKDETDGRLWQLLGGSDHLGSPQQPGEWYATDKNSTGIP